jgi:hypothetical protein
MGAPVFILLKASRAAILEVCMDLQRNDWVKTESGETGEIVHISRLTVFVAIRAVDKEDRIEAYLASQLTKVDRPKHP